MFVIKCINEKHLNECHSIIKACFRKINFELRNRRKKPRSCVEPNGVGHNCFYGHRMVPVGLFNFCDLTCTRQFFSVTKCCSFHLHFEMANSHELSWWRNHKAIFVLKFSKVYLFFKCYRTPKMSVLLVSTRRTP